jgi:hypothetical protein
MKSPSVCPCCGLTCFQGRFKICKKEHWDYPDDGAEVWCQFCNTWFMWNEEKQIAKVIETAFPRGHRGNKGEIVGKPIKVLATAEWDMVSQQRTDQEDLIWE